MAFDPWAQTNQGLSNLTNTLGTLAQLKQQDQRYADEAPLRALQMQQAQQGVEQGNLTLANLKGQQGALTDQYGTTGQPDALPRAMSFQAQEGQMAEQQKAQREKQKYAFDAFTKVQDAVKNHLIAPDKAGDFYHTQMRLAGIDLDSAGVKMEFMDHGSYFTGPVTPDALFMVNGKPTPYGGAGIIEKARIVGQDPQSGKPIFGMDEHTTFREAKPDAEDLLDKRLAAQEKNTQRQIDAADRRAGMKAAKPATAGHGGMNIKMNGLNPNQTAALTSAIGEGRLDPYKINSKNQQILADAAIANPGINLNDMAANLGLARNKDVQMKGAIAETVPPLLKSIVENGKKLNYSNNQFLGMAQQYIDKKTNNPQFVKYMTLRNDQLLTLGGIMRSNGMTDMAQRLEEEAAHPTMSPRALEGWLEGQMESVNPRLNIFRSIREGKGAPRPNSSASSGSYFDLLNKHKKR